MSATLADIAKAANTSISSVSRVLTNAPAGKRISQATRDRIIQSARELGYRPNLLARSLRTRKTHTIALIVSDIANPWFAQLASRVEQALHRHGYSLIVCNTYENTQLEQDYLGLLAQKGIDGLIIVPIATEKEQIFQHLPPGLPLTVLDRPIKGILAGITSDQGLSGRLLSEALLQKGLRRVGLIRGPEHVYTHLHRTLAIRSSLEVVVDYEGPAQRETGHAAWAKLHSAPIDAVVCTNNLLAIGMLEQMAETNRSLPLASFDRILLSEMLSVPMVWCLQNLPALGDGAVEMLLKQLQGQQDISTVTVPTEVGCNAAYAALPEGK